MTKLDKQSLFNTYTDFILSIAKDMKQRDLNYLHAAVGIAGEAGEVLDMIKKVWVYGKPLDQNKLIEELGDIAYYYFYLLDLIGCDIETVIKQNMEKLSKRFPNGYTDLAAINRADQKAA